MTESTFLQLGRHFVQVNGITLSYEVRGSGPLLVWHPGGPGMAIQGYPGYEVMAQDFTVVYLDPRGVGKSERLVEISPQFTFKDLSDVTIEGTEVYSLENYSRDLAALMELWGLSKINLAGHSHGGFVAFDFATRFPEKVEKLVLIGTSGVMDPTDTRSEERRKPKTETEIYKKYLRLYQDQENADGLITPLQWYKYGLLLQLTVDVHDFEKHETSLRETLLDATETELSFVPAYHFEKYDVRNYDMRPRYSDIKADVLMIQGSQELLFHPEDIEEAARCIPSARVVWIEECAHMPMTEQPVALMDALRSFIK